MIKVDKKSVDCPESLISPYEDYFVKTKKIVPKQSRTTHGYREKMLSTNEYVDNERYKLDDVKEKLEKIYCGKCAYCEQKIGLDVEHYRPKRKYPPKDGNDPGEHQPHSGYYWLSLSWDNLLLACRDCNTPKSSKFDVVGERITLVPHDITIKKGINQLSRIYDIIEKPLMLNPEVDDPSEHLAFQPDGRVIPKTDRGDYTIRVCKLWRKKLVENRGIIIEEFKLHIISIIADCRGNDGELVSAIKREIRIFKELSTNPNEMFLGFRQQMVSYLQNIVKSLLKCE